MKRLPSVIEEAFKKAVENKHKKKKQDVHIALNTLAPVNKPVIREKNEIISEDKQDS